MSDILSRIGLVSVLVVAASCRKDKDVESESAPAAAVTATTLVVTPQPFTETVGAIGNVVARAGHVATLSAPAAGRIATVLAATGQPVQAGEALVELDQAPFDAALRTAAAALAAAERANERQQRLADEGIVPRKDAETAAADVARARADENAARRASQLAVLRSPINGVVTHMSATLGASVDPAQPLVEISDPSALDVLLSVTPSDAGRVQPHAKVTLSAGQSANGEPLGVGTVVGVSGMVDSVTRSIAVRVQAPTTRRRLRIGETIFGAIAVTSLPSAIVIPLEALVPEGEKYKVFVVDPTGIAHEREVTVGGKTTSTAEIAEGLHAGEKIVTHGAYAVQDSARIMPLVPAAPPAAPGKAAKP